MFSKILLGIVRHPKRFFATIILGYTSLWAVLEPIFSILNVKLTDYSYFYLIGYILSSLIFAIITTYPKNKVQFSLSNTNTKVEIEFGDLFNATGHKVISATEFFDSKIGKPLSPKSLQGIFIEKILGGNTNIFDNAVDTQLSGKHTAIIQRVDGKTLKYDIGTTITIQHSQSLYFIFALSHTDNDCNAHSTPPLMLTALDGLWNKVRLEGNGIDINLPLIGNGLSRIGLPPNQLLQLILISLLKSVKEKDLSCTVRIILTQDMFDKIDLEMIKNNWQ